MIIVEYSTSHERISVLWKKQNLKLFSGLLNHIVFYRIIFSSFNFILNFYHWFFPFILSFIWYHFFMPYSFFSNLIILPVKWLYLHPDFWLTNCLVIWHCTVSYLLTWRIYWFYICYLVFWVIIYWGDYIRGNYICYLDFWSR